MKLKCIHHHHNPPLPVPGLKNNQLLTPPPPQGGGGGSGGGLRWHSFCISSPVRTKAMAITSSHLAVLGADSTAAAATATATATTGDLTVLIQTSAAFLFLYWIANFVVPEIIMKDLQSDDTSKDQQPNEEEGVASSTQISSRTKKKGFEGSK